MSSIPSNLTRVPNLMASRLLLSSLTSTNVDLLRVQSQLASNKAISRFSDNAIGAAQVSVLQDRLERGAQRLQNLSSANATLSYLDSTLGDATDLVSQAKSIASDQINATSDATTRSNQAIVIDGMIRSLLQLANRSTNGVYVFGGSTPTRPPIEELRGGFRYVGRGSGLLTDLGTWDDIPVTIGGDNAIGETSSRLRGTVDLNPGLTSGTRLTDLLGARSLGVSKGKVALTINGSTPPIEVDLSNADTVQDVTDALTAAIRQYETDNSVTVLGPGAVGTSGGAISLDVATGNTVAIADVGQGVTARDLGLAGTTFNDTTPAGADLNPKVTLLTPVAALSGLTLPLGSVRFRFTQGTTSSITDVDLSSAQTVGDIRSLIQSQVPGVRVELSANGRSLDVFNEISGLRLGIEEVPGGADTATELGIRSLSSGTLLSDFNNGRGVRVVDGNVNPQTGVIDRQYNTDFRITLGNGQAFDVDLRPQDLTSVQTVLDRINQEFTDALSQPPLVSTAPALSAGDFNATLTDGANGIAFVQTVGPGAIGVTKLNNSAAAEDLGLEGGNYNGGSATFIAQDRATVRVNNLFTTLMELRDALRGNDTSGITLAGEGLETATDRLSEARALVGVYSNRVDGATRRQEDLNTIDEQLRSGVQDLDYTSAAIQFNTLRTQLQAALQSGAQLQSLSLLDFLG